MEATIYYLNWDQESREEGEEPGPASELFHKLTVESVLEEDEKPSTEFSEEEFASLYRKLTEVEADPDSLEQVWKDWQRTEHTGSPEFYELRYCEQCDSYIQGINEAVTHATQNHGYDSFEESGEPEYVHGVRSMSIGDVIEVDGQYFQAKDIGFEEITVEEGM